MARTHLILLGEGADQTYVFFGPDFPGETGYGTFFDLDNPQAAFGTTNISPKPAAMTVAAMTRILDGTTTLGPVKNTPTGVYAYSFQQRGSGGKVVTALWTHNNAVWDASVGFSTTYSKAYQLSVDAPGTSGTVQLIDAMGNPSSVPYSNGVVTVTLTELPQYVVSTNATSRRTTRRSRWVIPARESVHGLMVGKARGVFGYAPGPFSIMARISIATGTRS